MEYPDIAQKIIERKILDDALRQKLIDNHQLGDGYNAEMEKLHIENAWFLNEIIDNIGYPTIHKVGEKANHAAWIIIQHAISLPNFMRKCAQLLEIELPNHKEEWKHFAYLTDRIAVFEGKAQLYGCCFDWDENGLLSASLLDDVFLVNQRRKSIGLNSIEEQTEIIRNRALTENHFPPKNLDQRKKEYDDWRTKVGWIPKKIRNIDR